MSPKKNITKADESNTLLSKSKKKNRKSLKAKGKIVKQSLNENSKLGESSTPASTSKKRTPKSLSTESQIAKKSSNENPKPLNSKETEKSQNLVKKSSNENSKHVNNKETQKSQNPEPQFAKKGPAENSGRVKEVKGSSTVQARNEDTKKLGGIIFMCNARTKPDCYHYRVMGVQAHKKELVMGIKPGMKLFLFDFDLKLLYGIYKASSAGGMKLEPSAFAGAFPLQVRFEVYKDCLPLPENVFKKAIKESYDEKTRKFSTELTIEQVKKLSNLFKPAPLLNSNAQSFVPEPRGQPEHENRQFSKQQTLSSPPLLLTEQEYRSYGLRGDRNNSLAPANKPYDPYAPTAYDPCKNDQERDSARPDMLFPSEKDYRTYGLKGRQENPTAVTPNIETTNPPLYQSDPYNSYNQNRSSVDPYLSLPQPAPSTFYGYDPYDPKHIEHERRFHPETTLPERLYSVNASNFLSEYTQQGRQGGGKLEHRAAAPVSSRYAFAGPSVIYR